MTKHIITETTTTGKLYEIARENGIEIVPFPLHRDAIALTIGGQKYIALNPKERSEAETARILRGMIEAHLTGAIKERLPEI